MARLVVGHVFLEKLLGVVYWSIFCNFDSFLIINLKSAHTLSPSLTHTQTQTHTACTQSLDSPLTKMQLPPEIITLVSSYLDFADLSRLSCASTQLYQLLAPEVWRTVEFYRAYVPALKICAEMIEHVVFDRAITTMFFDREAFPSIKEFSVSFYEEMTPWADLPFGTMFRNWRKDLYSEFYPELAEYVATHDVSIARLYLFDQAFLYMFVEAGCCHKIKVVKFDTEFTDAVLYHEKVYPPILRLAIVEKFLRAVEAAGAVPPFDRSEGSLSFWNQMEDVPRGPNGWVLPQLPANFVEFPGS